VFFVVHGLILPFIWNIHSPALLLVAEEGVADLVDADGMGATTLGAEQFEEIVLLDAPVLWHDVLAATFTLGGEFREEGALSEEVLDIFGFNLNWHVTDLDVCF
jgi:hypothetical protein